MMADQCQEAKAGDTMKKIQELTALKNQHRRLGRQNSRKEKGKAKSPISGTGETSAEQRLPLSHIPRESLWAQIIYNGHPDREINGANLDPSFTSRKVIQAKSALLQCWVRGGVTNLEFSSTCRYVKMCFPGQTILLSYS